MINIFNRKKKSLKEFLTEYGEVKEWQSNITYFNYIKLITNKCLDKRFFDKLEKEYKIKSWMISPTFEQNQNINHIMK
ncbi:MAG: hypothetical protein KatS3mg003_1057 [Candidatus Nitrosocaldaceae archaeon]|nr:MAG: hypothetical protein KatS3mg003_1057 [Candidatus Nitrosocaldaceae archaeon]